MNLTGVPVGRIAVTNLALVALLIIAGTVLVLAAQKDLGISLINIGVGIVVGGGVTTAVVARNQNGGGNGQH